MLDCLVFHVMHLSMRYRATRDNGNDFHVVMRMPAKTFSCSYPIVV
jgi:hypothetical protein